MELQASDQPSTGVDPGTDKRRDGGASNLAMRAATGRLQRAMNNHFEALVLFTIAVVVVTLGDKSSPLTATCGWAYLAARIVYVPAYAFGWQPWRSLIWSVGLLATTVMLVAALL